MTTHARSFAFHGLSVRDKLLMKSMIERASVNTERAWIPDIMESADCVFLNGEPPGGMRANAEPVCLRTGESSTPAAIPCPTRVSEFRALLSSIDRRLGCNHWHPLIENIQLLLQNGKEFALLDVGGCGWMLHPAERQYSAFGLLERGPRELMEEESSHWRLGNAVSSNRHPRRALEVLLWYLGLASGSEGVLPSIGAGRPLRMRTWPYLLARAPRQFSQFATLLRAGPRSAIELQVTSNAPMAEVAAFVNACALCGFLTPVVETAGVDHAMNIDQSGGRPAQRFTRFIGAIRVALGMT